MIELSNLRIEKHQDKSVLIVDIDSKEQRIDSETTIWISVDEKYGYMLTEEVYDAFLFLPVYMSMYYHTDLHIRGKVSKKLYRNVVKYLQPIMCDFSPELVRTNIIVDGFEELKGNHSVVGTGISCGVDCLSTIYDNYIREDDPEYKITHLFMLNCGWHGEYGRPETLKLFKERCKLNKKAADAMGLPMIEVDSNLHAFLYPLDDKASYFNLYTSAFAFEKEMRIYYVSSTFSYGEILRFGNNAKNKDFSEYADPIAIPLMRTDAMKIVNDGCQFTRVGKTNNIASWEIAQKFLNVCCRHSDDEGVDETNCSNCVKCRRTLIALDGLGMLDNFSNVFDLNHYQRIKGEIGDWVRRDNMKNGFATDIYNLFERKGKKLP